MTWKFISLPQSGDLRGSKQGHDQAMMLQTDISASRLPSFFLLGADHFIQPLCRRKRVRGRLAKNLWTYFTATTQDMQVFHSLSRSTCPHQTFLAASFFLVSSPGSQRPSITDCSIFTAHLDTERPYDAAFSQSPSLFMGASLSSATLSQSIASLGMGPFLNSVDAD